MNLVQEAEKVLQVEAQAILALAERLQKELKAPFLKTLEIMSSCQGKVILSGIGKSGFIARKIASTMSSTGTPAFYVHPAETSHGDMGVIASGDVVVILSYGGESGELQDLLKYVARKNIPLIAMTGSTGSTLAKAANVVLDVSIAKEACPLNLAPTASTTVSLALGDALAMTLLQKNGFKSEDFAEFHPGGKLGRRLLTKVKDVMHAGDSMPVVQPTTSMKEVIYKMTAKEVRGVAGVVDESGQLMGVITDGDIRRRLEKSQNPLIEKAVDIMSVSPKTIDVEELAEKALFMMEQFQIQTLFAVEETSLTPKRPVGILHLQDLLKFHVR